MPCHAFSRKLRGRARWVLVALLCMSSMAWADDAGTGAQPEAGEAGVPEALEDPRTAQIRALMEQTLGVAIDPQNLFDVPLDDEEAIAVERVRIARLLEGLDRVGAAPESAKPGKGKRHAAPREEDAGLALDPAAEARLRAREELDRARLAFYSLPQAERKALLAAHAAQKAAAQASESDEQKRAREAEEERARAVEAARAARSEAERLVGEERVRLLGIERHLERVEAHFAAQRRELVARRDNVFGWQRRARDARAGSAADADATYAAIRRALRASRDALDEALQQVESDTTEVPAIGPDPLLDIPPEIPTDQARKERHALEQRIQAAKSSERALREDTAASLLDEINTLNRERLMLLPHLSAEKRDAITGFTEAGLDQAKAELRHLLLILRYHQHAAIRWVKTVRRRERSVEGFFVFRVATVAVPWFVAGFCFVWWRRRSPQLFARLEERMAKLDRADRRTKPSVSRQLAHFARGVHRPLEWLLFFWVSIWLLPEEAHALLEVQLFTVVVGWSLGASLIVHAINALAATFGASGLRGEQREGELRFRSLRLVGRVVVAFALILLVSSRLVGEGTIYSWVLSTCWFAALPVFFILVRWWRETVFERIERARKKSRLETWILQNKSGLQSFVAAMVGAVELFLVGAYKTLRNWLSGFELVRRGHAYLFKRELDRLTQGKPASASRPLRAELRDALSSERSSKEWTSCRADEPLSALKERIEQRRGGVVAIVGACGMGKSTLVERLRSEVSGTLLVSWDAQKSVAELREQVDAIRAQSQGVASGAEPLRAVVLDDAHRLLKPVLGGLREFDGLLAVAGERCAETVWVFVLDAALWPFLRRARDSRPLFDQVYTLEHWTDEEIGALLMARSQKAGFEPVFDDLLELPPGADELDRQEAAEIKRAGYFRMVWDYARGNPAMALEVWRSSLVEDSAGGVRVRPLRAPDASELDALSDIGLFVLRAVLQMSPAAVADVAQATRLTEAQVEVALRFGEARGCFIRADGRIRIAPNWLRSVMVLLERRHLLVNS